MWGVTGVCSVTMRVTTMIHDDFRIAGNEKISDEILEDPNLTSEELTELIRQCYAIRVSL